MFLLVPPALHRLGQDPVPAGEYHEWHSLPPSRCAPAPVAADRSTPRPAVSPEEVLLELPAAGQGQRAVPIDGHLLLWLFELLIGIRRSTVACWESLPNRAQPIKQRQILPGSLDVEP